MILNSLPLVSVIVTTYNRSNFLAETIHSIANQTYRNIEILIVDDGSTDEVAIENQTLCKKYNNCKYFYKPNSGQPSSRNYGIKIAKGDYIGFCDDDDIWRLDKLDKQINIFISHPEVCIVTGDTESITATGKKTGIVKSHTGFNHGYIFKNLLVKNRIQSPTPVVKKEVFDTVGYFNPDFTIAEDWEFWRRVSYCYPFYALNEVLAYMRLHDSSMSSKRQNTPIAWVLLHRKLTKSLLKWGNSRFTKTEINIIFKNEWAIYRKLFINNCPGIKKKLKLLNAVAKNNMNNAYHILFLIFKFELFKK